MSIPLHKIPQCTTYLINKHGQVWSIKNSKYLKPCPDDVGYLRVTIIINNARKTVRVHRIVALTFIPNPNNYKQVNHIDGNKANNHVDNLEWCTSTMNNRHFHGHEDYKSADDDRNHIDMQDKFNDLVNSGISVENALYALD